MNQLNSVGNSDGKSIRCFIVFSLFCLFFIYLSICTGEEDKTKSSFLNQQADWLVLTRIAQMSHPG